MLGQDLVAHLATRHEVIPTRRHDVDITDSAAVTRALDQARAIRFKPGALPGLTFGPPFVDAGDESHALDDVLDAAASGQSCDETDQQQQQG